MKKFLSITSIILIFIVFCLFDTFRKSTVPVLSITNASTIQVDLNKNGKVDFNETICIPDVDTFTADLNAVQTDLCKKYNLSKEDAIKIGYLSDIFADNTLSDKKVNIKNLHKTGKNCSYADIIINNSSYKNQLINSGYGIPNGRINKNFSDKLENARKLNLVILNHKSNKYHKLTCEYGLVAHDAIILPERFVSDAVPCKFCHIQNKNKDKPHDKTFPSVISDGYIKLFLTDSTLKLKPDNKCETLICRTILNEISNSKQSIDIALYGWNNVPNLYDELIKAKSRGVKIRIVYNYARKDYYPETKDIVKIADDSRHDNSEALMHDKFMIFDNESVITGSMNFSNTGFSGFNANSIVYIKSKELAKIYQEEFSQMLSGKFKNSKTKNNTKTIIINNTKITPLFSPTDKIITRHIIPLINNAQTYIYVPAFTITHNGFAQALIKAKQRGVDVKIISDATNPSSRNSKIKLLRTEKIPVKIENYAGKIHSKSIIIDDKYIVVGSANFSNSGENHNDENSLIIENQRFAKYYKDFFIYYWNKIPERYLKYNPAPEGKSSIGSCFDGVDNDYDGKIDSADSNCNF